LRLHDALSRLDVSWRYALYSNPQDKGVYRLWGAAIVKIHTENIYLAHEVMLADEPGWSHP